jgi:membrane protease YdiL (CAAX protease family)
MGSVSFILSFFVPGLLYLRLMDIPINYALPSEKVKVSVWVCLFLAGSGLALLSNLPVNWMSSWLGDLFPSSSSIAGSSFYSVPTTRATIFTTILSLLNTTLLPAFFEEFIFRGVLLGQLRRFGNGFAVFVSAILFGIFHSTLHQVPFAFLVGLVLGYIIVRTNQIWITIAVHFYNNAFACLPDIAKPLMSSSAYNLLYQLVFYGTMVVGALAILFLLWKHRDVLIPRQIAHHRLSLSSRWFAWISAPATWLVVALCCVRIFTDWA